MAEVVGVNSRDEEDEVDSLFKDPVGDGPLAVISCHLVLRERKITFACKRGGLESLIPIGHAIVVVASIGPV